MQRFTILFATALLASPSALAAQPGIEVAFSDPSGFAFSGAAPMDLVATPFDGTDRARITEIVQEVAGRVRELFPDLADQVTVAVARVARDLSSVGGVSGRAEAPGEILIELQDGYPGGLSAQTPALRQALFHELHHLVRGWTIRENAFGPGIAIAAVNEGLAEVFAEEQTGSVLEANEYPANVDEWAAEIQTLPVDADYGEWMFEHPDGRLAIGYRTGRYIIHQAMANSGMTVLELTEVPPREILELAGIE